MKKLICNIPEETHFRLKDVAKKIGTTKSSLVKLSIEKYMRDFDNE
jgi:predicted DNA-binding protein